MRMDTMIEALGLNTDGLLELCIDNNAPFTPESCGQIGMLLGETETTRPEHKVRNFVSHSRVSVLEYTYDGRYMRAYYRRGEWENGTDGRPRFHVWELLE